MAGYEKGCDRLDLLIVGNIDKDVHVKTTQGFDLFGSIYDYDCKEECTVILKPTNSDECINIPKSEISYIEPVLSQKKTTDNVNHPSHYQSKAGLEVIDIISAFTEDLTGEEAFCTGNAIKYICRWKSKNGVEDLNKAKWYIDRMINQIEKEKENNE